MANGVEDLIKTALTQAQMQIIARDIHAALANLHHANKLAKREHIEDVELQKLFDKTVRMLPMEYIGQFYHESRHQGKHKVHAGLSLGLSDQPGDLAWTQGYLLSDDDGDVTRTGMQAIAAVTDTANDAAKSLGPTKTVSISADLDKLRPSCDLRDSLMDTWDGLSTPGKALVVAGAFLIVKKVLLS